MEKRTLQTIWLFHTLDIVLRTLYISDLNFISRYEMRKQFKKCEMFGSHFMRNCWTRDIHLGQSDFRLLLLNPYVVLPYFLSNLMLTESKEHSSPDIEQLQNDRSWTGNYSFLRFGQGKKMMLPFSTLWLEFLFV